MSIDRSILTDHLLDSLEPDAGETRQWAVGDHEKPAEGGYQGEYGMSEWVPYVVLTATPSETPTGDFRTPGSDVWFGYAVTVVGRSRRGAERTSSAARERLGSVARQKLADGRTVSQVQVTRYGGVDRLPAEPPLFLITDQVRVFTTK